jgi:polysaccharide pyruvyl transferase WcaK-like protein
LLNLFESKQGKVVRAFDRYPQYLYRYDLRQIIATSEKNIITNFDNICRKLLEELSDSNFLLPDQKNVVTLNQTGKELSGTLRKIKRKIAVRKRLAKLALFGKKDARNVVNTILKSDKLIWNPAGEIHPTGNVDEVFRILILVRIAQLAGKKTYIVNHSLELFDDSLTVILGHVYQGCSSVLVRDHVSVIETRKIGVKISNVFEVPDAVFLTFNQNSIKKATQQKGICLAINGLEAFNGGEQWSDFFRELKKFNKPIHFLSNAMNHDMEFANNYAQEFGIEVVTYQPGYKKLQDFYADFDVLISSRLHSAVLALAESIPVVIIVP